MHGQDDLIDIHEVELYYTKPWRRKNVRPVISRDLERPNKSSAISNGVNFSKLTCHVVAMRTVVAVTHKFTFAMPKKRHARWTVNTRDHSRGDRLDQVRYRYKRIVIDGGGRNSTS